MDVLVYISHHLTFLLSNLSWLGTTNRRKLIVFCRILELKPCWMIPAPETIRLLCILRMQGPLSLLGTLSFHCSSSKTATPKRISDVMPLESPPQPCLPHWQSCVCHPCTTEVCVYFFYNRPRCFVFVIIVVTPGVHLHVFHGSLWFPLEQEFCSIVTLTPVLNACHNRPITRLRNEWIKM